MSEIEIFEEGVMEKNVKTLGGLGALFIVLSVIPYIGVVLGIAGVILLFIALKKLSESEDRKEIFSLFLKGFLINLIGGIVGGLLLGAEMEVMFAGHASVLNWILATVGGVVLYVSAVWGNYYVKRSFELIAMITGNTLFAWAGKLLFWGAVLIIILIGGVVSWVGWILTAVAFFTTEEKSVVSEVGQR